MASKASTSVGENSNRGALDQLSVDGFQAAGLQFHAHEVGEIVAFGCRHPEVGGVGETKAWVVRGVSVQERGGEFQVACSIERVGHE
ncbi:hypothetical protein ACTQ49_12440 [Luteococcus sp. Sow4_B9]|uniref:hypothetical protein n=1 Tax=Luteococcus sp. Sow4_B9 TaxID=3438792 RepID=UPI003F95AAD2